MLYELSGGCEKIVAVSGSFWSSLKFLRMMFLTARLLGLKVRVNRKALLYSRGRIATFFKRLAHLCGFARITRVVTAESPKSKKLMEILMSKNAREAINGNSLSTSVHYKPTDSIEKFTARRVNSTLNFT